MKKSFAIAFLAAFVAACASAPSAGEPYFGWTYDTDGGGIPQTAVGIKATYPDGTTVEKHLDDVEGECNDHPEPDADVFPRSTMIICYYAGLGRYYKVTQSGSNYLVQRKVFEEASPDYDPPVTPFETIAVF